MISNIDYNIYKAIHQNKKLTEIFIGCQEFDWYYSKVSYSATCTEAIDFTLFDKTICGLLQIEDHLSIEQIGRILGFNVIDNPAENKYKDIAEYEILKEALESLQDYEMIDVGDTSYSYCTLTNIGKEYVEKGKKFIVYPNKRFDLFFDETNHKSHALAKENFQYAKGEGCEVKGSSIAYEDEGFLKTFAMSQIPSVYNPITMNSFKDAELLVKNTYKISFHAGFLLDIQTGVYRAIVIEGDKEKEFFTNYLNDNIEFSLKLYNQLILSKYQLKNTQGKHDSLLQSLSKFQENFDQLEAVESQVDVVKSISEYYNKIKIIEPVKFITELNRFFELASDEVWLMFKEANESVIKKIKELVKQYKGKRFFVYLEKNIDSKQFYEDVVNNLSSYDNLYVILVDTVEEFNVLFKNNEGVWNVFKTQKVSLPIIIDKASCQIDKLFVVRNTTKKELDENYISTFRNDFAKQYIPLVKYNTGSYFATLNLSQENSVSIIKEIKTIDEKLAPFKSIKKYHDYFSQLKKEKENVIQAILSNREKEIKLQVEKISQKLAAKKDHNLELINDLEEYINQQKSKCLDEEFKFFISIEKEIKEAKFEVELARKRKAIIIDTNILIEEPNIIDVIGKNQTIVFSAKVLDELDTLKIRRELKEKAKVAIRNIHRRKDNKNIKFKTSVMSNLPEDFDKKSPDNIILSVAMLYQKKNPVLLTNDKGMGLKAKALNIPAKNIIELKELIKPNTVDNSKSRSANKVKALKIK